MKSLILSFLLVTSCVQIYAQFDHQDVFSEATCDELRDLLIDDFRPVVVLSYGEARD